MIVDAMAGRRGAFVGLARLLASGRPRGHTLAMSGVDQPNASQPDDRSALRAAGLSAVLMCCAAMVVAVREPAPGPLGLFVISTFIGAIRGLSSPLAALAMIPILLWPLWAFFLARRGWRFATIAPQVVFHLAVVGYVLLRTSAGQRDATLLTSLPLAMAITFTLYDVMVTIEGAAERHGAHESGARELPTLGPCTKPS